MFLIAKGECSVSVDLESKNKTNSVFQLHENAYFGEISLIYKCRCTAQVTAKKYCNLAVLNAKDFGVIIEKLPTLKNAL
jgi:CRP-like cAMP-binding protein